MSVIRTVVAWRRPALSVACAVLYASSLGCSRRDMVVNPFPDVSPEESLRPLTAQECRDDLEEVFRLVEAATPTPYLFRDRASVRGEFDRLGASIHGALTRRQFVGVLREACASYGIAHQYVITPHQDFNNWREKGGRAPSFSLAPRGDTLTVAAASRADIPVGGEILSINGVAGPSMLSAMRSRTSAETATYRDQQIANNAATLLWEMGFEAPYTVVVCDAAGAAATIVDEGVTPEPRPPFFAMGDQRSKSSAGPAPEDDAFSLSWPEPGVALIDWRSMNPLREKEWGGFLEGSFRSIADRAASGLIIDIRNNGGGSSNLAAPLLARITDKPFRFAGGKTWRKSKEYDAFLESCVVWWVRILPWRSMFSSEYAGMRLGEQRDLISGEPAPPELITPAFNGPVVFLIGPKTFSSAAMLADAVATYRIAPLVGRPTGGVPNSHGELGFHRLSGSGVVVSFCSALFIRANGDASDPSPVLPTIPVEAPAPSALNAPAAPDPDIAAALRWIKQQPREHQGSTASH